MKKFKVHLSLFLLFLFVFPLVNKEIHNRAHANDVRCVSITAHLHELEHNCSFCDFKGPIAEVPLYIQCGFIISTIEFAFTLIPQQLIVIPPGTSIKGRAPPAC